MPADATFAGILQTKLDSLNILHPSVLGYDIQDYLNVFQLGQTSRVHGFRYP